MFAIRQRRRSPRSSRFVPAVDGLPTRIVPVSVAPLEISLVESEPAPEPVAPPTYESQTDESFCEMMAEMLRELQEECQSTAADV